MPAETKTKGQAQSYDEICLTTIGRKCTGGGLPPPTARPGLVPALKPVKTEGSLPQQSSHVATAPARRPLGAVSGSSRQTSALNGARQVRPVATSGTSGLHPQASRQQSACHSGNRQISKLPALQQQNRAPSLPQRPQALHKPGKTAAVLRAAEGRGTTPVGLSSRAAAATAAARAGTCLTTPRPAAAPGRTILAQANTNVPPATAQPQAAVVKQACPV